MGVAAAAEAVEASPTTETAAGALLAGETAALLTETRDDTEMALLAGADADAGAAVV